MDKILVTVNVPSVEMSFDIFLPINKKIGTIKKYLMNTITELTENQITLSLDKVRIIDQENGLEYENNILVKESKLKNGSSIVLV